MTEKADLGHFVWHDLMTSDVARAKQFYADLLGWDYQIEHATDFAWRGGAADYPLILAGGEAHGGFVDLATGGASSHWLGYVAVDNVDAAAIRAAVLGATIDRQPFDVPGVGRSAVIRDPQGAMICPYVASHNYPAPNGQFLADMLITDDVEAAKAFYVGLFGWSARDTECNGEGKHAAFTSTDGLTIASVTERTPDNTIPTGWVPRLACADIEKGVAKAESLGAELLMSAINGPNSDTCTFLSDLTGAIFVLTTTGSK